MSFQIPKCKECGSEDITLQRSPLEETLSYFVKCCGCGLFYKVDQKIVQR